MSNCNFPKVSVCMITYNHENFIREAIEGVLMQVCDFEVELVVANDCSTDKTDEVIQDIIQHHPKASWINYTNHIKNKGMMPNFIWALEKCKGEYIALCEGDDYWTDTLKLQKQIDFLDTNLDYIVCFHDAISINENGNELSNSLLGEWKKDYSNLELKKGAWLPTLTRCFRNEKFNFPKEFYQVNAGDHFLTSILGLYGKAKYIDFKGATYREHKHGIWNSRSKLDREYSMLNDYLKLCKFWKSNNDMEIYNYFRARFNKTNENLLEISFKENNIYFFLRLIKINFLYNKSFFIKKNMMKILYLLVKKILKRNK